MECYDGAALNFVAAIGFVPRGTMWALTVKEMKECRWLQPQLAARLECRHVIDFEVQPSAYQLRCFSSPRILLHVL